MQLNLSDDISKQLEERVRTSDEFDSVNAYVEYVLQQVLTQTAPPEAKAYDGNQEDAVKQRLEDLGYLD